MPLYICWCMAKSMKKYIPNTDTELMRLRVPAGWAVSMHKFYDAVPRTEKDSTFIENWYEGFTMDVLWIQEVKYEAGKGFHVPDRETWYIDMGWTQDSRIDGEYHAELKWSSVKKPHTVDYIQSRDRFVMRDKIEYWMMDIHINYLEYQKKMKAKYR